MILKRYAPLVVLVLAAALFWFVQTHKRGSSGTDRVTISAAAPDMSEGFNRHPVNITYTKHAKCRAACRHISEEEIREILENGRLKKERVEETRMGFTYPLEGKTSDDKFVRIVVAPKKNDIVIVTVIDLDKDWPCDCK